MSAAYDSHEIGSQIIILFGYVYFYDNQIMFDRMKTVSCCTGAVPVGTVIMQVFLHVCHLGNVQTTLYTRKMRQQYAIIAFRLRQYKRAGPLLNYVLAMNTATTETVFVGFGQLVCDFVLLYSYCFNFQNYNFEFQSTKKVFHYITMVIS